MLFSTASNSAVDGSTENVECSVGRSWFQCLLYNCKYGNIIVNQSDAWWCSRTLRKEQI